MYNTGSYVMVWMLATSANSTHVGCKDRVDTGLPEKMCATLDDRSSCEYWVVEDIDVGLQLAAVLKRKCIRFNHGGRGGGAS